MFGGLRDAQGRVSLRMRAVAALLVLGLATLSAPVLIPMLDWLIELALP